MFLGIFIGISAILVGVWLFMVRQLVFALSHFSVSHVEVQPLAIEQLPSVSVCLPARNEMHVMADCLQSVLQSTYPKLEVLVLDDHSEDTTSTLVKSFAREGVRFIDGKQLPKGWLGKNHALQGLLDEASGSYILFMDVDTRVEPTTITQMVSYMQTEKAAMLSVLPCRVDGWVISTVFSPLRYFWELIFHRKNSPATASNAWMIERRVLISELNGFHDISAAIQPESRLSARLMPQNRYRFIMSNASLGLSYAKKWRSQLQTSTRLLFPLLGGEVTRGVVGLLGILLLLTPFVVVAQAVQVGWTFLQTVSAIIAAAYIVLYVVYTARVWRRGWWLGALLWPIILVQEFVLIIVSMERYLLHTVTWKGRPIATPDKE